MNLKNYSQVHRLTAIAFILALALVPTASAADGTWTGGTSVTWATAQNWSGSIVPGGTAANSDLATFNSGAYSFAPTAVDNYFIGGLIFGSSSGAITITTGAGNNRLNVGSGGIQVDDSSGAVSIGASGVTTQGASIIANQNWANNSSSLLTVNRVSVDNSSSAGTYTLTINGSGSGGVNLNTIGDVNGGADPTRLFALQINSTGGNTTISTGNNFTGGTTLTQGNLLLGANTALGTGILALNGGKISSSTTGAQGPANNTTIGGNVTLGDAVNNGKLTFSGTMGLGGDSRTLTTDSSVEFSGVVSNGGITKQGASTLTFLGASANTYTGTTTVNHGTLVLAKTAGVNAIAGGLTIGDGTNSDTVNLGASDQIADTVVVNMVGTASAQRGNFQLLGFNETIGGLSGGGQVQNASSTADSVLTLNVANATTQTSSAVLRNTGGSTTGSLSIVKTGGGTQILGGNMTYTGVTSINQGTLAVTGSLLSSGTVLVNDGGSLSGSGSVGAVTLASGSFLKPGNSPGTLTAASSVWQAGSTYSWEIDSNESAAEVGTNWDLFSVTGALDMSALKSTTQMNLVLNSLPGFDLASSERREWVIAQAGSLLGTGGAVLIAGANVSDYFSINASAFNAGTPSLVNEWRIKVGDTGKTLNLMAIPEPSTGTLLGFGLGGLVLTRLLRRKQS
jgi:autotransporter-associated beta strand protein